MDTQSSMRDMRRRCNMLKTIKRCIIGLSIVAAFISLVSACSVIESPQASISSSVPWIISCVSCSLVAVILDRPSRVYRYFLAAHVCFLAWKYLHNFKCNRHSKHCAVLKHRYHTYRNLYRRVVEYYKYEIDDGGEIFQ